MIEKVKYKPSELSWELRVSTNVLAEWAEVLGIRRAKYGKYSAEDVKRLREFQRINTTHTKRDLIVEKMKS